MWVGDAATLFDQSDGFFEGVSGGDQDCRAHSHRAMNASRAMGVDPVAISQDPQGGVHPPVEGVDGNGQQGIIEGRQPEHRDRWVMRIGPGSSLDAHVYYQPDSKISQGVVIVWVGGGSHIKLIGNLRKIHVAILP
jgi:hypothetical protein